MYSYKVMATDLNSNVIETSTYTRGIVDTVSFDDGVGYVHIGDQKYMLSEILEVTSPKSTTDSQDGDDDSETSTSDEQDYS